MLSLKEAKYNFIALQICSWINFLPFRFDHKTGRIQAQTEWRRILFCVNYFFVVLYDLHFIRTLIQTQMSDKEVPFNHFSAHTCFILGMSSDVCRAAQYFVVKDEIVIVFNELYFRASKGAEKNKKPRSFWKLSGRERLARLFIVAPIIIPFGYFTTVMDDPTRAHVLATSMGITDTSSLAFKLLLLLECYFVSFLVSTLMFVQFVQLSAFEKIMDLAKEQTAELQNHENVPGRKLYRSYRICRKLQLLCKLENKACAMTAYFSKMFGLFTVILNMFYAITLLRISPPDSINNAINGTIVFFTYLGIYDKAYLVLEAIVGLKRQIGIKSRLALALPASEKAELERALVSIRHEGVQMGGFYNVEREATLISVDFITGQVASLLVGVQTQ